MRQGEWTKDLYFISKGTCKATCVDMLGNTKAIRDIHENGIFGEISHILNCKRTATVTCVNYVTLLAVPKFGGRSFKRIMPYLKQQYIDYDDSNFTLAKEILQSSLDWLIGAEIQESVQSWDSRSLASPCIFKSVQRDDIKGLIK